MRTISQTSTTLISLLLLGALAFAGIVVTEYVNSLYMSLDPQFAHVTVVILVVILVASWTISRSVRRTTTQEMRKQFREEISTTYQYFLDYWIEMVNRLQQQSSDYHASEELDQQMALYGSAEAIKAHLALRFMTQQKDIRLADIRLQFGKALLIIRKDLGADSQKLSAKDLQQLVLPEQNPEADSAGMPQPRMESEPTSGA